MRKAVVIVPFLSFFAYLAFLGGCSKSKSSPSTDPKIALITKAAWKLDVAGVDLNKDGTIDIVDTTIAACKRDNSYLFNKDSTGIADEGATKCNPADPQTKPFTWYLSNNH